MAAATEDDGRAVAGRDRGDLYVALHILRASTAAAMPSREVILINRTRAMQWDGEGVGGKDVTISIAKEDMTSKIDCLICSMLVSRVIVATSCTVSSRQESGEIYSVPGTENDCRLARLNGKDWQGVSSQMSKMDIFPHNIPRGILIPRHPSRDVIACTNRGEAGGCSRLTTPLTARVALMFAIPFFATWGAGS